jgi:putative metallopeptidase DUF4344
MTTPSHGSSKIVAAVAVVLTAGWWTLAAARAQGASGSIANNDSIFIDGKTFEIRPGKDTAAQIKVPGARELGPGTIIFRSGDKLYIVDAPAQESPAGDQAAAAAQEHQGSIHIEYVPPKKPEQQQIYELAKEHRPLEALKQIFGPFRLPEDLYIKTVGCDGKPNAYFSREDDHPTIRICYEYLQANRKNMPTETTKAGLTPHEVVAGQLLFAAAHELGHAMFDIYNLPVLGRQEDAADQFATYFILEFGGERARRLVLAAAYAYRGFIKQLKGNPKVTLPLADFSSDHSSPEERFYNLACIAYGYDPKLFAGVVDKDYLPAARAKVCKFEYQNVRYAMHTLISPHLDAERLKQAQDTKWFDDPRVRPAGQ